MTRFAFRPRTLLLAAFASTSVIHFVFALAMGWLLVPGDFGLLVFAQTVLFIGGLVLSSGFPAALTAGLVAGDTAEQGQRIRGALVANTLLAAGMSALVLLLFVLGPLRVGFETLPIAVIVALTLPCLAQLAIVRAAAQGLERFEIMAALHVIEVLAKVLAGVALVGAGFGVAGAIAASLASALVAAALALWMLSARLGVPVAGTFALPSLGAAGDLFGALIGLSLLLNIDQVMLKLLSSADRDLIGQYQAAAVLAHAPYHLAGALLPILFTRAARHTSIEQTGALVGEALRLGLLAIVPLVLALAAAPAVFLGGVFPRATAHGVALVPLLGLANASMTFVAILCIPFNATGNARSTARILAGVIGAELFALWALAPIWQSFGAALSFFGATTFGLLALGRAYWLRANVRLTRGMLGWWARYAVALGAGVLLYLALPAGPGAAQQLRSVAGAGGCYLACAFALRLIAMPRFWVAAAPAPAAHERDEPAFGEEPSASAFVSQTS